MTLSLDCYRIAPEAPPLIPARQERAWMDATPSRFAYRCLPLTMANTTGWELRCPTGVTLQWNGGDKTSDLIVTQDEPSSWSFASSHFGSGIVTFHTGWLLRTSQGVNLMAQGSPNEVKDGIQALSGLVETDWLPFPFTMNWKMTRPGLVRFEPGESYCFVTLMRAAELADCQPLQHQLSDNPELERDYREWSASRSSFNARLLQKDAEAVKQGWQRHYHKGQTPSSAAPAPGHVSKRLMKTLKPAAGLAPAAE
jgi:hypothetical protein